MKINSVLCIGCGRCVPYCPVEAIDLDETAGKAKVDMDLCVECGNCLRSRVCPKDAFYQQPLEWPRTVRSIFSDVLTIAEESKISGRGTEEMKTNDVTGRFRQGWVGVGIELGRPGVATSFRDVEKVTKALSELGNIKFEKENPTTSLIKNKDTGELKPEVLEERALSAIVEFSVELERLRDVIDKLEEVEPDLDTVFSLEVTSKCDPDGSVPHVPSVEGLGLWISPNAKNNVGLGRPLFKEEE